MAHGINTICKNLIKDNIPSPTSLINNKNHVLWNGTTIRRILKNEVYIGNTVGHKVKKINYKIKKQESIIASMEKEIDSYRAEIKRLSMYKDNYEKIINFLNQNTEENAAK